MDLLARPVGEIAYQDVVDFCIGQAPESTVLDYKQQMPRDLAKHVAAMSNRYGGLIIVGVEEDPQTGLPLRYDGLPNSGKLVERANQFVSNVRPLPSCIVRTTDESNGNVFLLVRVHEGGAPPYRTTNDPTVYLRTGNVTTPLGHADAEVIRDLYAKQAEAEALRAETITRAEARLEAVLQRRVAARGGHPESDGNTVPPITPDLRLLTAYIQPFYPRHELAKAWAIEDKLDDLRLRDAQQRCFPERQAQPIAGGLLAVQWTTSYQIFRCHQVYANGLVFATENTVWPGEQAGDRLRLGQLGRLLYLTLRFAGRFYADLGYSGLARGGLGLTKAEGRPVQRIILSQERFFFETDMPVTIDSRYHWPIEANTHQLADDEWLPGYFKEQLRQVYWDLGYSSLPDGTMEQLLAEIGLS